LHANPRENESQDRKKRKDRSATNFHNEQKVFLLIEKKVPVGDISTPNKKKKDSDIATRYRKENNELSYKQWGRKNR